MGVLDRLGYVRANYNSNPPGLAPDQTWGNTPSVFAGAGFDTGLGGGSSLGGIQGSVQATGVLIIILLGLLVLAHKKLPMGLG